MGPPEAHQSSYRYSYSRPCVSLAGRNRLDGLRSVSGDASSKSDVESIHFTNNQWCLAYLLSNSSGRIFKNFRKILALRNDCGLLCDPPDGPLPAPFEACLPNEGGPARGCLTSSGRATGTRTVMHRAGALRGATEKSRGVAEGSPGQKVWSEVRLLVVYNDSRPICYSTPHVCVAPYGLTKRVWPSYSAADVQATS